jgi:hypothetical protein
MMKHNRPANQTTIDLHGLKLAFQTPELALLDRFEAIYGHLPHPSGGEPDIEITWRLHPGPEAPAPQRAMPLVASNELISHYRQENMVAARLPKYALVTIDLKRACLFGQVTQACLDAYGVFEDVMMITLAPLYRRRGWFPLHAFAGLGPNGKAALLTGQIGAGKTTTGLALLSAGWKLLSNDSPLLTIRNEAVHVLAYPGRLSAFDDSLARFERLKQFIPTTAASNEKRVFRAEDAFPDPWAASGPAGGLFFLRVTPGLTQSGLTDMAPKQALLELMPQAVESWDSEAIAQTFHLLRRLVEQVPCHLLELAPDIDTIPGLIEQGMTG